MSDKPGADKPDLPLVPTPEEREEQREPDGRSDQIGIIPGKVPGHPVDPSDPRFPGSQPDLA
ncbi:hypothetical protein [Azospirillum doebereinerae]|uniref:Uncharacterized protein n=1 Tax=Azospirillum doebereinerae TaxID=92933 RepID=A0A3S0X1H6_9PROT|nr:hypothetical protein [Azospirillum doebereinerae]MCG5240004.1 hypothetical protein [Azospirillum doebereinerae]RUQ75000.1 hypothetical protein EJ913_03800 [Azospirillum doebereinerae]